MEERNEALKVLKPYQKEDFKKIFTIMGGQACDHKAAGSVPAQCAPSFRKGYQGSFP